MRVEEFNCIKVKRCNNVRMADPIEDKQTMLQAQNLWLTVSEITERGNNTEVRRNKYGSLQYSN
ncbi:TPA: hypothetical protein ACGU03_002367 [Enterococcus faecium]|uniref:hypothetical protein n=1 Tax=Enterococcus faecium TaxID=1352 RepID=UPI00112459E4|nr:hypothetical protein [Enterococcus faecium]MCU7383699.1 hypothetical protein [Enterococcus faecium]QDB89948.1 hypothetical protein FHK65_04245 [Enterococcus faecium]HAQ7748611.1 hypothetical protein [Enterococcus faecium]HCD9886564.1 hypothetical protein [Enterococcus faecium]